MIESPVTVLPHPDSPTTPSVSPSSRAQDTPWTARRYPSPTRNSTLRSETSSRAAMSSVSGGQAFDARHDVFGERPNHLVERFPGGGMRDGL